MLYTYAEVETKTFILWGGVPIWTAKEDHGPSFPSQLWLASTTMGPFPANTPIFDDWIDNTIRTPTKSLIRIFSRFQVH
jgi:hypothetical protein